MNSPYEKTWVVLGNIFEHYDTALYVLLTPFFASLFLTEWGEVERLILAYTLIPFGMMARPLGALVFGKIGDTRGREKALVLSLIGMGGSSLLMAFLPENNVFLGILLLIVTRAIQNFCMAGQNMGGAIYLLEGTQEDAQDKTSSFYATSSVLGGVLASLAVSFCYFLGDIKILFRFLYLFGGLGTLLVALFRRGNPSNPLIWKKKELIFQVLWEEKRALFQIALTAGFSYATYSAAFIVVNGFGPIVSSVENHQMVMINSFCLWGDMLLLPVFGGVASFFGRRLLMKMASFLMAVSSIPIFASLEGASLPLVCFLRFLLMAIGVAFCAPWHAWAQKLVVPSRRFLVISFGYALGALFIGGPFASFSLWIYWALKIPAAAGLLLSFLGFLTFSAFFFEKDPVYA